MGNLYMVTFNVSVTYAKPGFYYFLIYVEISKVHESWQEFLVDQVGINKLRQIQSIYLKLNYLSITLLVDHI